MIRLSPIDAPHYVWPIVEAALVRVKEKTGEKWTPDFVLHRITSGHAGLFRIADDGEHLGWLVVERYDQGEEPWMNVWIIEGQGLERAPQILPLIDALAGNVGCKSWRCTGRKGWKALGLEPIATVYERELI